MKRFMVVLLVVCCVILCASFSFAQQKRPITEKDLPVMIDDLFLVGNGSQKRLTAINAKLCGELNLTMPEDITYTSFDGKKIEGFVQKPPDFDPNKDYAASELWTAIPCGSPEYRRVVPTSESTIRKPIAIRALSVLIQRRTIISELFRARSPLVQVRFGYIASDLTGPLFRFGPIRETLPNSPSVSRRLSL